MRSDTFFLAGLALPPAKVDPSQIGLDVIFKNATKPCARVRNPHFWNYAHPRILRNGHPHLSGAAILNSGVQWALHLRPAWKNETMRMVSIFRKISKSGATATRAHSLTFFVPTRLNHYPRITDAEGFLYLCAWTLFCEFMFF